MLPLLDPTAQLVIGHRGASALAPENTLAGFRRALAEGADALELDVHVTADGVPVVIHDPTLERTTDRVGAVAESTLERLREADAGARFTPDGGRTYPWRGKGERVPTLAEVIEALPDTPILIELKDPRAQLAVRGVLLERGAVDRCVVASNDHRALAAFHQPPFLRGASRRDITRLWLASKLGAAWGAKDCLLYAVPPRHRGLEVTTDSFLAAARCLGRPVHVWTVDDPALATLLWERGASGIITNAPGTMVRPKEAARARSAGAGREGRVAAGHFAARAG